MQNIKFKILSLLLVVAVVFGCAAISTTLFPSSVAQAASGNAWDYTGTYYDNLNESLDGAAFRAELAQLITSTHKTSANSYDKLKSQFNITDANPETGSGMLWFYTGTEVSSYGGSSSNREHVWPKDGGDAFPEKTGPGCDLQHLRPTDMQLNSSRGSYSFNEVAQTSSNIVKQNDSTTYGKTADELCYSSGGFFYPAKGYRGATARILMYVQTRWGDQYNLTFVDSAGKCKTIGKISTLLKWHLEEPPTASEIYRNQKAYEIQGNRNPFIDHPEWATKIYCNDGNSYNAALKKVVETVGDPYNNSQPLESISFQQTSLSVAVGSTATLTVVTTPSNAKKNLTWTSSNASVATVSNGVVTGVSAGTATITATDKDTGKSATATVTVKTLTGISVSGTPAKTEYTAGNVFSPTGLTVTATYSDGSTSVMDNSNCQWLDGVTKSTKLSQGTTTVICKYGSFEQTISGITVNESKDGDVKYVTIDTSSFEMTEGYGFKNWSTDAASGFAFIYGGGQYSATGLQFNVSKDSYYLASKVALPGRIVSVTVKIVSGKAERPWKLLTSDTAYTQVAGKPTNGTDWGTQMVTAEGVTWTVDSGDDTFFALTYELAEKSGASYLDSIVIGYVEGNGGTVTPTPDSVSLNKTALSLEVGASETLVATVGGSSTASWSSSNTNVATVDQNGKVTAVGAGTTTITVASGTAKATCTVTVTAGSTTTSSKDDYFDAVVANPTVGSNYKLALWQESLSKVFYAVAEMTSDGYIQTTENVADAAIVSLEAGTYEGCYYLKLGNKYVSLNSTWSGKYVKASITLTDSPTTEFYVGTHNELAAVVTANDGDGVLQTGTVYLGTHGSYSTIAASSTYYLEDETAIDVSQYVARLVVADGGSTTPDPTPDDAATEFKGLVSAVQSATGMEAKFNAIKAALVKYGTLTDEQKTAVASDYQTLQNEIASYNQGATSANEEHNAALKNALASGSLISAGFVALLSFIKRKFQ